MKKILILTLALLLTACAEPGTAVPTPAAQPDTTAAAPGAIITGDAGPITTTPVTTADPHAPIETVTHRTDPNATTVPFTTAAPDPATIVAAVPSFTVEPVTDRSTAVRFSMNNQTGKIVWTSNSGFPLRLEQKVNGEWVSAAFMPGIVKTAEIYSPRRTIHGESRQYSYDILDQHGTFLTPGEYRIPFEYSLTNADAKWPGAIDQDTYVLFTVKADPDPYPITPAPDAPDTVTLDFAAAPADTPGMLLLRVTNATGRQINFGHVAGKKLEMKQGDSWVAIDPNPIDPADRVNIESTSSVYMQSIDPHAARLFAYPLDCYSPLAPGEYRIVADYGLADPNAEGYDRFTSLERQDAAWHFTVAGQ